jgi:CBS-domain-containing membrane protein
VRFVEVIDKSFIQKPRNYIIQSLMALAAMLVILSFVEVLTEAAIVAALGASAFIVFAMPRSITARPRRLIGGHAVGIVCGLVCYYAFLTGPLGELSGEHQLLLWFAYALSVALSLFFMTITNTEHPPAASTALGIAAYGCSLQTLLFILLFAIGLAIVRRLLGSRLIDLF